MPDGALRGAHNMVQVSLLGRLGNNLFQYALGRLIAEHRKYEFRCARHVPAINPQYGEATAGAILTLEQIQQCLPGAPLHIAGRTIVRPTQVFDVFGRSPRWSGHLIHLDRLLRERSHRAIFLRGYFQRYEYFAANRARIRKWFALDLDSAFDLLRPTDVVLSIRRGADYAQRGWVLPMSYYTTALARLSNIGTVFVCGTCIDHQARRALARYRPVYCCDATPLQQLNLMIRANRLVMANSTFAWWGAFLGSAAELYAPVCSRAIYGFSGYKDVDLRITNRPYTEIAVP